MKERLLSTNLATLRSLRELNFLSEKGLKWLASIEEIDGDNDTEIKQDALDERTAP